MSPETGFGGAAQTRQQQTAKSVVYGAQSDITTLQVVDGNTLAELSDPTDGSGDITLTYTLKNYTSQTSSIKVEYSEDGETYSEATSAGGDDGNTGLTTSSAGTEHTFIWDTTTDLGKSAKTRVDIRIKAFDQDNYNGAISISNIHTVTVDNSPLAPSIVSPASLAFDKNQTPTFVFTIPNPVEGDSDMHFKLELDTDQGFASGDLKTFESRNDPIGWEYYDDTNWIDFPSDGSGVPVISDNTLIGNQARYTVQTEDHLTVGLWYWRVTAAEVT